MKINRNLLKNKYQPQLIIILFFLNNIYFSLSSLSIGRYPYAKRLNNGDYIIISSLNIIFTDDTFS